MANCKPTPDEIAEALKAPTITPDRLHQLGVLPLSRGGIYQAIRKGEIPSIQIGRKRAVITGPLKRMLGIEVA